MSDDNDDTRYLVRVIALAKKADWGQVVANGGPPCFRYDSDRDTFCLRAQCWAGHDVMHKFFTLDALLHRVASILSPDAEVAAAPLRAENEALRQRIAELERIAGQQWLDAVRENQEQFDRAEAAERDLLALRQFFDLNPSSLGAKLQAAERELADAEVIIAMRERELAALKRPVEDAEIGGTCNVCGGGVRYGERHYQCGRAVIGIETELAEARAQLAEARKDETDAQRYRWWRAFWMTEEPSPEAFISAATEDEVDAAVDAEIAKGKP